MCSREFALRLLHLLLNIRSRLRAKPLSQADPRAWTRDIASDTAMCAAADQLVQGILRAAGSASVETFEQEVLLPARILLLPGTLPRSVRVGEVVQELVDGERGSSSAWGNWRAVSHVADFCLLAAMRGYVCHWQQVLELAGGAVREVGTHGVVAALLCLIMLHEAAVKARHLEKYKRPLHVWLQRPGKWYHGGDPWRDLCGLIDSIQSLPRKEKHLRPPTDGRPTAAAAVETRRVTGALLWHAYYSWVREAVRARVAAWKGDNADPGSVRCQKRLRREFEDYVAEKTARGLLLPPVSQ